MSTAVSSPTTVSASQKVSTTAGIPSQHLQPQATPPHPPRPQQGQVKLTMAQLTQLTQGQVTSHDLREWDSCSEQKITIGTSKKISLSGSASGRENSAFSDRPLNFSSTVSESPEAAKWGLGNCCCPAL